MARTYDESVKYLMEKGGLTEDEAKARLDSRLKAPAAPTPAAPKPTPAVNGAAAARPPAPTPSQTAPAAPAKAPLAEALHPREYLGAHGAPGPALARDADRLQAAEDKAWAERNPVWSAYADFRRGGRGAVEEAQLAPFSSHIARVGRGLARAGGEVVDALRWNADEQKAASDRQVRGLAGAAAYVLPEVRGPKGVAVAPPAADYLSPSPLALAPAAKPAPAVAAGPTPMPAADWPGLGKADAYILSLKPGADLNQWSPEQRLAFYAERKAASSKE